MPRENLNDAIEPLLLNDDQNDAECDATGDDSSTAAKYQKEEGAIRNDSAFIEQLIDY